MTGYFLMAFLVLSNLQSSVSDSLELTPGALWEYAQVGSTELASLDRAAEAAEVETGAAGRLPDPMIRVGLSPMPIETRNGPVNLSVTLSQRIPWPGTLSAESGISQVSAGISDLSLEVGALALRSSIATQWGRIYLSREHLDWVSSELERMRTLQLLASAGYSTGTVGLSELLMLEIGIALNTAEGLSLEAELSAMESGMNQLLGRGPDEPFLWPESLPPIRTILPENFGPPLDSFPGAEMSRLALARTEAMADLAASMGRPMLEVGGTWTSVGEPELEMGAADPGRDGLTIFAGLTLPLGYSGAASHARSASLSAKAAELDLTSALSRMESGRRELTAALEGLAATYEAYEQVVLPNLESMMELAQAGWMTGQVGTADLLDIAGSLADARMTMASVYAEAVTKRVLLAELEGDWTLEGGFL